MSKADLARCLGVTANTITSWMDRGCPHEREGRLVKFRTVEVLLWLYGERPSIKLVSDREARAAGGEESDPERRYLDPDQERARKDSEMADKLALQNQERRGELIETAAAVASFVEVIGAAKAKVLGLGSHLAVRLAKEKKPAGCQRLVDQATRAILMELSRSGQAKAAAMLRAGAGRDEKEEEEGEACAQ